MVWYVQYGTYDIVGTSTAAPNANLNPSVTSDKNPEISPPNESSSPLRKKKKVSKPKHGLTSKVKTKNKKTKKLVISASCLRNKEQKDALAAKPEPSMWKYLNLPKGHPTKQKETTTTAAPTPTCNGAVTVAPATKSNPNRKKKHKFE